MKITDAELAELLAGITPGPWAVFEKNGIEAAIGSGTTIVLWGSGDDGDDGGVRGRNDGEADANGRAASRIPDLLADLIAAREALRRIAALYEGLHHGTDAWATVARDMVNIAQEALE